jgi:hypothetical protein
MEELDHGAGQSGPVIPDDAPGQDRGDGAFWGTVVFVLGRSFEWKPAKGAQGHKSQDVLVPCFH